MFNGAIKEDGHRTRHTRTANGDMGPGAIETLSVSG